MIIIFCVKDELIENYNFIISCNNIIVNILKYADSHKDWKETKLNLKEKDIDKWNSKRYTLNYFRKHGYAKKLNNFYYKVIMFSLFSDYCSYVYDSIECAKIMHPNQAFTLLRKPLKDNLLLIEKFFTEKRFISHFLSDDIDNFEIGKIINKKNIIKKCCKKIEYPRLYKQLFNIRYDKSNNFSLEKIWNKTIHIITTNPNYKTENGSLNMIFSSIDDVIQYDNYYFAIMPLIQFYIVRIMFYFLYEEGYISQLEFLQNNSLLTLNYYQLFCDTDEEYYKELITDFHLICPKCGNIIKFDASMIREDNVNLYYYFCKKCNNKISLSKFIHYSKEIEDKYAK